MGEATVVEEALPWNAARERCRVLGKRLSTLEFVNATFLESPWVAAVRSDSNGLGRTDMTWLYTGESVEAVCPGEHLNDYFCAAKNMTFGCVERRQCGEARPFVCGDDESPEILENYQRDLSCRLGADFCDKNIPAENETDCWTFCSQRNSSLYPLAAVTVAFRFFSQTYGCCCYTDSCCLGGGVAYSSSSLTHLDDGVLGSCALEPSSSKNTKNKPNYVLILALFAGFSGLAFLVFTAVNKQKELKERRELASSTNDQTTTRPPRVEATVAASVLVEDVPLAKVVRATSGDIELSNSGRPKPAPVAYAL